MTLQESLQYHPHKLAARGTIAAPIARLMQAVDPRSIRTLSMPGELYDFENMPRNSRWVAPNLEFIHNICVEKEKDLFENACRSVPIRPDRRKHSKEGKAIESNYKEGKLDVKTSFIRGDLDKILTTAKDISYEFNYDDWSEVDMDIIWLDYCGAFTPTVQDRLVHLAKGHIAPCGLLFLTVRNERFTNQGEGVMRGGNRLKVTSHQDDSRLDRIFKKIPPMLKQQTVIQDRKEIPIMENLQPVLRRNYYGGEQSTTPMLLGGWAWQRRKELSKRLINHPTHGKRSWEVVKLPFDDHEGDIWSLKGHRGEHIQFTLAKPKQKRTKQGTAYTLEEYVILDDWFGPIASHQKDGDYDASEIQTGRQGKAAKEEDISNAINGLEKEHSELGQRIRGLDRYDRAGMLAQVSGRLPKD